LEHGQNIPERHHLRFSCRVCNNKESFIDGKELDRHCQTHYDAAKGKANSPRSSRRSQSTGSRSSSGRSRSRSRSRDREHRRSPDHRRYSPDRRRGSPVRRSPDRNRGGGSGRPMQGQTSFTCHFCKDQFRTLSVRKNHMLREHEGLLFNCGFCTFVNMYRRDLLWHLREHHRKQGYSDEMMLREFVRWPKDLRKVVCIKCTESEANENATWLGVDPNEITKELEYHAEQRHSVTGHEVETCFSLQCSGCTDKFELPGELKYWDEHMETTPCKHRQRRSRYYTCHFAPQSGNFLP